MKKIRNTFFLNDVLQQLKDYIKKDYFQCEELNTHKNYYNNDEFYLALNQIMENSFEHNIENEYTYSKFKDEIFAFSNEFLDYVIGKYNLKGKDVLTVGSSGDQLIYSILCGAKNICHFDINKFSRYFIFYKIAAIKNMEFEEFCENYNFIKNGKIISFWPNKSGSKKNLFLSSQVYAKISHDLPEDVRAFWDNCFLEQNEIYIDIYGKDIYNKNAIFKEKYYYDKARNALIRNDYCITTVCGDAIDIPKIMPKNIKFDYIFFSNIFDYMENEMYSIKNLSFFYSKEKTLEKINNYETILYGFSTYLRNKGKIQIGYDWGRYRDLYFRFSDIYNKDCYGKINIDKLPDYEISAFYTKEK